MKSVECQGYQCAAAPLSSAFLSGFTVRFFFTVPVPFFARVTLMGSGVLVRSSSSGISYDWKDGRGSGGIAVWSNSFGVGRREEDTGVNDCGMMTAPVGI